MNAPCKNCSERHTLCHSHCEKYLKFRAELDKANEVRRKYTENRNFCIDVTKKIVA